MKRTPENKQVTSQGRAFMETARAIGCDESEDAFKARLGRLLSSHVPPKDRKPLAAKGKAKPSKKHR